MSQEVGLEPYSLTPSPMSLDHSATLVPVEWTKHWVLSNDSAMQKPVHSWNVNSVGTCPGYPCSPCSPAKVTQEP